MPDILSIYAEAQPDKPGVIDDKPDGTVVTWTYAELEARSNRVANLLLSLGSGPGKKVMWCGPNSPEVVAVINAARKIGAVAVPLNYRLTPEEAEYVVNHSDAQTVYVDWEHAPMFAAMRSRLTKVEHLIAVGGPAPGLPTLVVDPAGRGGRGGHRFPSSVRSGAGCPGRCPARPARGGPWLTLARSGRLRDVRADDDTVADGVGADVGPGRAIKLKCAEVGVNRAGAPVSLVLRTPDGNREACTLHHVRDSERDNQQFGAAIVEGHDGAHAIAFPRQFREQTFGPGNVFSSGAMQIARHAWAGAGGETGQGS